MFNLFSFETTVKKIIVSYRKVFFKISLCTILFTEDIKPLTFASAQILAQDFIRVWKHALLSLSMQTESEGDIT